MRGDRGGKEEAQHARRDGDNDGPVGAKQVDVTDLHDGVADETSAQTAEDGQADVADEVELAFACVEEPGEGADDHGSKVKPDGDGHAGSGGALAGKEVWKR